MVEYLTETTAQSGKIDEVFVRVSKRLVANSLVLQDIYKGKVHNNLIRKWTLSTKRVPYYKRSDFKDYKNCLCVTFQGHDGTTGNPNFKSYIYIYVYNLII